MIESFLYLFSGLVLLVLAGELLIRSASTIAAAVGISPLVIGLTIVAFGTSAPELVVSIFAALQGSPEIALANVIGSNIFNIGFILGICALISPLVVNIQLLKLDVPILIIASGLAYAFCYDGQLSTAEGFILCLGVVLYTFWLLSASKKESQQVHTEFSEIVKPKAKIKLPYYFFLLTVSLGVLVGGSKLFIEGAISIAKQLGLSDTFIGLTIVAAGTSLPEVATSVMATIRGHKDIAIGNVIGSNIFNILFILGVSAGISSGLNVNENIIKFDFLFMLAISLLCLPLVMTSKKLVRWEGALLLSGYIVYTLLLVQRG